MRATATSSPSIPLTRQIDEPDTGQERTIPCRSRPRKTRSAAAAASLPSAGASSGRRSSATPAGRFPDAARARAMSTTEQIIWAHRVDKDADVKPGATLRVYADLLPASDGTAPFAIHTFNQITGGNTIDPRQAAIANDHFVFTGKQDDDKQTGIGRQFAAHHG